MMKKTYKKHTDEADIEIPANLLGDYDNAIFDMGLDLDSMSPNTLV